MPEVSSDDEESKDEMEVQTHHKKKKKKRTQPSASNDETIVVTAPASPSTTLLSDVPPGVVVQMSTPVVLEESPAAVAQNGDVNPCGGLFVAFIVFAVLSIVTGVPVVFIAAFAGLFVICTGPVFLLFSLVSFVLFLVGNVNVRERNCVRGLMIAVILIFTTICLALLIASQVRPCNGNIDGVCVRHIYEVE